MVKISLTNLILIFDGHGLPGSLIVPAEPAINSDIVFFLHLVFLPPWTQEHSICYLLPL